MNTMNMPGFTAEAGLVSTAKTIWRAVAQATMHSSVVPQQMLEPVEEDFPQFGIKDFRDCYNECRMPDPITGKRRRRFGCIFSCAGELL